MDKDSFLDKMSERTRMFLSDGDLNKIRSKTVALVGLGGIGAIVLEMLVRTGVTKLRIMDMDKYEMSNLNRQIFATINTVGKWKTETAIERIKEINPFVEVEMVITEKANRDNVDKFVKGADLFILEADFPSGMLLFHESARKYKVPLIDGGCVKVKGGSIKVFDYRDPKQICRDRIFRSSVLNSIAKAILGHRATASEMTDEELANLDKAKVPTASLGFLTNAVGCIVVAEAIKFITGKGKSYRYPKEIYIDLFNPKIKIRSARSFGNLLVRLKDRFVR